MARGVVWGIGKGLSGQEAGRQAAQQALELTAAQRPVIGFVFIAQEYDPGEVVNGLEGVLTNIPLWGFSTVAPWSAGGEQARSVVVMLVVGPDAKAMVNLYPTFAQDGRAVLQQVLRGLKPGNTAPPNAALIALDGISGDSGLLPDAFSEVSLRMAGGLASGQYQTGKTFVIGGNQVASGAASVLQFGGRLRMGIGAGHGWKSIGRRFKLGQTRGIWLNELDGTSPAAAYETIFGVPARQWAFPPLNELVRQYPLGVQGSEDAPDLQVSSPLRAEVDGRFRMSSPLPEGETAQLMVGDAEACLEVVRSAVQSAREDLGEAKPLCALVFIDLAWEILFQNRPGQLSEMLNNELGNIPVAGGYTLGQVSRPVADGPLKVLNQHLVVALIGEVEK